MSSHHTLKRQHDVTPATTSAHPASVLEIVARITRGIVREWDADVVMRALVREACDMLDASAVMLWLTGAAPDDVSELTLAYSHGLRPDGEPNMARCDLDAAGVVGRAAVASDLMVVMADDAASLADPLAGYLQAQGLATMLLVPLEAHGRMLGVAGVGSAHPHAFDTDESRRHARLLGDLCALAVESTGLQERLRKTNAQLVAASIEAQQRAEELSQEKHEREAFISLVAHELKNPLAVLTLQVALLQRGRPGAKRQETSLRIMAVKAAELKRLIDDLLDASRIAVGHFSIEPEPIDVAALARDVVQEQQAATKIHHVRLDVVPGAFTCSCDRQRLAQALSNLVSNAIKYSPNGGEVVVRVERADELVRISVTDRGAGLSADDLAHLFEPYTRLLRVREALGAGLGLFITKGIIEAHGGSIAATSAGVGHGSAFTLTIPCMGEPVPSV